MRYTDVMRCVFGLSFLLLGCQATPAASNTTTSGASTSASGPTSTGGAASGSSTSVATTTGTSSPDAETTTGCATGCGPGVPANCDESESGGSAGGDDTGLGMDGDPPLSALIPDIQMGKVPPYTSVLVEGLVATSPVIDAPVGPGSMFTVSDPAGGLYSAITVRVDAAPANVPIERGEGVTLQAEVRGGVQWLELRTLPEWIANNGTMTEPPPVELDLETLQAFADDAYNARPYDSVVVTLPPSMTQDDGCAGELQLAYGGLRVDDRFLLAQGAELPAAAAFDVVGGTLLNTLNGLEVAPRSLDELGP